ncbi:unnamed protein product [Sphenostylis stenocarpa]|uniref:AMP-dependent synthetase/ligase domain-containing protein n=1 Tax=Sphenostylis stenocarpa TaxID=92480 RepID=A0AA86S7L6_9FABA|nr:unnamed protein product [Sphenostylis stenocarpa]
MKPLTTRGLSQRHGLLAALLSSLAAGAAIGAPSGGEVLRLLVLERHVDLQRHVVHRGSHGAPNLCLACTDHNGAVGEAFGAPVLEAYAMMEASHLMSTNPLPKDGPHRAGSVGKLVGQEMAILDEKGEILKNEVKGEVCIRGPNVTKGYKNNPDANISAFQYGWFHTGDISFFFFIRMDICTSWVTSRSLLTVEV